VPCQRRKLRMIGPRPWLAEPSAISAGSMPAIAGLSAELSLVLLVLKVYPHKRLWRVAGLGLRWFAPESSLAC
jgi:hypothetical protein